MDYHDLPVLPEGVQNFRQLRHLNAIYVDKTRKIHQLMSDSPVLFFTRPRRFGKSLMLSTLAEAYKGEKELFRGTWLYNNYDFSPHQVLHLDLGKVPVKGSNFDEVFIEYLYRVSRQLGLNPVKSSSPGFIFADMMLELHQRGPLVVLIDEYEKPLFDVLGDPDLLEECETTLRGFYQQTKSYSEIITKCVMTGLSRMGLNAADSGANHFKDISLNSNYTTLCG